MGGMVLKRRHRLGAIIIVGVITLSMVGLPVFSYFYGGGTSQATPSAANTYDPAQEFADLKSRAQALTEAAKSNPDNLELQTQLGNTYYDLGTAAFDLAPADAKGYLEQAIAAYQAALKGKKDISITVDMATAAFYAGNNELAESGFQAALSENPNFYPALVNYGRFLYDAKKDYATAMRVWQQALNNSPSDQNKQMLQSLIAAAQGELQASLNGK